MAEFAHLESQEPQKATSSRPGRKEQAANGLVRLQRLVGNQAVSSFLVQRQDDAGAGDQSGAPAGQAAGMEMMTLVAMSKPGIVNVTLKGGQVTDASATIGTTS